LADPREEATMSGSAAQPGEHVWGKGKTYELASEDGAEKGKRRWGSPAWLKQEEVRLKVENPISEYKIRFSQSQDPG
jgi:hypothetical protein